MNGRAVPGLALVALLLAGCAAPVKGPAVEPPAPPPTAGAPAVAVPAAPAPPAASLAEFERRQRAAAESAAQQGQWFEAAWAWDVVLALRPDDAEAAKRRAQAAANGEAAAAERLQRARQSRQRGDTEAAARLYLEVLALVPGDTEAAEAMRAIERDRVLRQHRRAVARSPAPKPTDGGAPPQGDLEHAAMMAAQGEIEGAIALLRPIVDDGRRKEPAAAAMLADLYWRQAEKLAATDRAAAIVVLQRLLLLQPKNAAAQARLRQLRELNARSSTAP